MNILIVTPSFFPNKDVGAFRMTTLSDFLAGKGEHVIIIRTNNYKSDENIPYKNISDLSVIKVNCTGNYFVFCREYRKTILKCCKDYNIGLIIYTCGPYYAMLIAANIKKKTNVPYILDIRDFWIKNEEEPLKTRFIQNIVSPFKWYIECLAFRDALKIVLVSPGMKKKYAEFLHRYKEKYCVIYNGYDDQRIVDDTIMKCKEMEMINCFDGIKIGISGGLSQYSVKYTKMLLESVEMINQKYNNIKIFHMGNEEKEIPLLMKELNIKEDLYCYMGYMPNEKCIRILELMDANVIINLRSLGLGTKTWDYIKVNKPIIYIGKEKSELARFLRNHICTNKHSIEEEIIKLNQSKKQDDNKKLMAQYIRSVQNEKYYKLIKASLK